MTLTLQEILHTCNDWQEFCRLHGFSEWAVNEGGGDVSVELTAQQAHYLGIRSLPEWKVEPRDSVYPPNVTVQGTRHLVEGTLQPIVGVSMVLFLQQLHTVLDHLSGIEVERQMVHRFQTFSVDVSNS